MGIVPFAYCLGVTEVMLLQIVFIMWRLGIVCYARVHLAAPLILYPAQF